MDYPIGLISNNTPAQGIGGADDLVHLLFEGSAGDRFAGWRLHIFRIGGGGEPGGGEDGASVVFVQLKDSAGEAAESVGADGDGNVFTVPGDDGCAGTG